MVDVEKITKEKIEKGGVLAILYFDMHANKKEVLTQIAAGFVQKLLKEPGVVYAMGEIDEPLKVEENLFSTALELKILTDNFIHLMGICATYSPFSIEILRPERLELTIDKMHELLMLMSTTTHDYKKYILEKVSTQADAERYAKTLKSRAEMGKRLLESGGIAKKGDSDEKGKG